MQKKKKRSPQTKEGFEAAALQYRMLDRPKYNRIGCNALQCVVKEKTQI